MSLQTETQNDKSRTAAAVVISSRWSAAARKEALTALRVLREPQHPLQPAAEDALAILAGAIERESRRRAEDGHDNSNLRSLLRQSLDWLENALQSGRLLPCREAEEALEEWQCALVVIEQEDNNISTTATTAVTTSG